MSLKKNIIANYVGQGWTALMGLAFVPLYIKYLGMEAYGLIGVFALLQAWLLILDMGMTPAVGREMARFTGGAHSAQSILDLLRSIEFVAVVMACLIALGVWGASGWLASRWLQPEGISSLVVKQSLCIMGVVVSARFIEGIYRGILVGLQRQVLYNAVNAVMATLRWMGAAGVLIWISPTIKAFFIWQGVVSMLSVVALVVATYRILPRGERKGSFSLLALKSIQRFAGGMVGITFLSLMLTQVDKVLLSKLVSLEDFGYYTLAASVAGALYFLITPISTTFSPRLAELVARSDQKTLIKTYHSSSQWMASVLIPPALMIAAFSEPLLYIWTGNANLSQLAGPLLSLLALGTMCNGFMHTPYMTQLAHGWTGLAVRVNIVAVGTIIPAILWSVPRFGAIAAAWCWLILNAGYVTISMHFMHRQILHGEKWQWYWLAVFKPLLSGIVAVLILRQVFSLPSERIEMAAVLVGFGVVVMGAVLWAAEAPRVFLLSQMKLFWRKMRNA